MIVRPLESCLRLITQTDHAHWAYQLLRLWPEFQDHPRREAILLATRLHDRGWQGIDSSPIVDANGLPHDFRSLPCEQREAVWRRGVDTNHASGHGANQRREHEDAEGGEKAVSTDSQLSFSEAWKELLICHHAWSIHQPDNGLLSGGTQRKEALLPLAAALRAERQHRLDEVAEVLAVTEDSSENINADPRSIEAVLERDYLWLRTLDFLSLVACNGWEEEFSVADPANPQESISSRFASEAIILNPFPFKGTYSLPIRHRDISSGPYHSNQELALALARAPWQTRSIKVSAC